MLFTLVSVSAPLRLQVAGTGSEAKVEFLRHEHKAEQVAGANRRLRHEFIESVPDGSDTPSRRWHSLAFGVFRVYGQLSRQWASGAISRSE